MWRRYKAGESQSKIGLALGRSSGCIFAQLVPFGGIAPRRQRSRSALVLSMAEREEISRGLAADASIRSIAQALGRAPSTVSREVRRHAGQAYRYRYRARAADWRAWERARRPKACLLSVHGELQGLVAGKLQLDWSPQQISGWLKTQFPDDESLRVSPETIYRTLFVQARGALKKELLGHLRGKRRLRRSRVARKPDGRGQIADAISIRERPAEVEDRAVPGHWEGDLLLGSKNSHMATLVERQSRFTTLIKLQSRDTDAVVAALARHIRKLPTELRRSLTWDRGREMKHHKDFTVATDVKVYFCDPSSPWQRGTNENTNGLLRQYFPKGTDLSGYSQAYLDKIALRLNQRPRKTLGFKTPADKLHESVALTD
jgi:IS30 family transposase